MVSKIKIVTKRNFFILCVALLLARFLFAAISPHIFSVSEVTIQVTGEKNQQSMAPEIWLLEIKDDMGSVIPFGSLTWGENWLYRGGVPFSWGREVSSLKLKYSSSKLYITFRSHDWSGKVRVISGTMDRVVDLYAPIFTEKTVVLAQNKPNVRRELLLKFLLFTGCLFVTLVLIAFLRIPLKNTRNWIQSVLIPRVRLHDERIILYIAFSLLLLAFLFMSFYNFVTYKYFLHSDGATKVLLAKEMVKNVSLFPRDWNYVNAVWVLTTHLLILPFAMFVKTSFLLHALGGELQLLLLGLIMYQFFKVSGVKLTTTFLILAFCLTGLSSLVSEWAFGQATYGFDLLLILLALLLMYKLWDSSTEKRAVVVSLLFLVLLTLMNSNFPRSVLTFVLPLLGAVVIYYLVEERIPKSRAGNVILSLVVMVGSIPLGYYIFRLLGQIVNLQLAVVNKVGGGFPDIYTVKSNIEELPFDGLFLLDLLGSGRSVVSLYSAGMFFRFLVFSFLLVVPFFMLFRFKRIKNPKARFFLIFYFINLFFSLFYYVFSAVRSNIYSGRYFSIQFFLLVILFGFFFEEFWLQRPRWRNLVVVAVAVLVLFSLFYLVRPYYAKTENPYEPLNAFLQEQGISYGYADDYWIGGIITLLSADRCRMNPIEVNRDGVVTPLRHLSSESWYQPQNHNGPTALIITDEKWTRWSEGIREIFGPPLETHHFMDYIVFKYDYNVAERFQLESPREYVIMEEK